MFEAVYIADLNDSLVYEYRINLASPHFKSLISIIRLKKQDGDGDGTGASEDESLIEINEDYFVAYERTSSLIIYVLCSESSSVPNSVSNPVIPYVFIKRLIEVMADYFGTPLAVTKIDANNDTLTLLINEMIDNGMPNVTDFNKLRDLIPFKSFLSKILGKGNDLAAATNKTLISLKGTPPPSPYEPAAVVNDTSLNSIPWRRSNVKYTNNEMYVDVVETINVILKPVTKTSANNAQSLLASNPATHFDSAYYSSSSLKTSSAILVPIVGNIEGEIKFVSHLTGVPLLQMILSISGLGIKLPSFHPCIKLDSWVGNPGTLSFIPPDGKSTLMQYQIDLDTFPDRKSKLGLLGIVTVDFQSGLGVNQNEFEIKLLVKDIKSVSKIENLVIEVVCASADTEKRNKNGDGQIDEDDDDNRAKENAVVNIKASRVTHGDFSYKGNGRGEWNLRSLSPGLNPFIHGSIVAGSIDSIGSSDDGNTGSDSPSDLIEVSSTTSNTKPIKPLYLKMSYTHKGALPSGLKVDSLKIVSAKGLGETVKPYKGVKYITKTGDFIIRS
ncbi:Mu homology domain-containing protein [Scheffersomyces amazonensis]|uniref:Mu homology domain-containing protein n=1 Tax=Scheffersomyces amazonensis TaxID=1078765 RepID=UPI00315C9E4C